MTEAPSIKEALEHYAEHYCEGWCERGAGDHHFDDCGGCIARRALATLSPPAGDRREAIRDLVRKTAMSLPPSDFGSHRAIEAMTDAALASGLVQDEAVWLPIDTAPKDGTEIIGCFCNDYGYQENPTVYGPWTIAWDGKKWRSSWDDCEVISSESDFGTEYKGPDIEPTHWMPLPAPPIRSARDGGAES